MDNFKHMSPSESAFRHDILLDLYTAVDDRQDLRIYAGILYGFTILIRREYILINIKNWSNTISASVIQYTDSVLKSNDILKYE
jgi:hypothetical protein